jgi:hypothetical protein
LLDFWGFEPLGDGGDGGIKQVGDVGEGEAGGEDGGEEGGGVGGGGRGWLEATPPCIEVGWGALTSGLVSGTGEKGPPPPFEDSGTWPVGNGGGEVRGVVAAVRVGEGVS